MEKQESFQPNKEHAAVCGLFCRSCPTFIGTFDDPEGLAKLAEQIGTPVEKMRCEGCRSEKKNDYCKTTCKLDACALEKGIDFCSECNEFPCEEFKSFEAVGAHRIEAGRSLKRIKEVGFEKWYGEMIEHYSCPECNTINSAYHQVCRKCGKDPSCNFVAHNQAEINQRLSKIIDSIIP